MTCEQIDEAVFSREPAPAWGSKDAALHEYSLKQLRRVMNRVDREKDWITGVGGTTLGDGQARLLAVMVAHGASAERRSFASAPLALTQRPHAISDIRERIGSGLEATRSWK